MQGEEAEQQMRISVAEANAKAVDGENIAEAKIAQSQATLLTERADAYERGESRKREAEAAVLEVQNRAMAKAALAEAERIEAEERAKVEAPAKAEKARIVVDAQAEAERRRLEAEGEAAAIYAKLEAEARGQYEILAKKGEGLKQIVERLRRGERGFPANDAGASGESCQLVGQGDLEYQVRQGRGLGERRTKRSFEHGGLSCTRWPARCHP